MDKAIRVKICGLRDADAVDAAVSGGADYVGFNFFPKSPRYVTPVLAAELAARVPTGIAKVGLVVNPDNAALDALLSQTPLDFVQLHGAETPDRVVEVKRRTGLPVIKVVGVADESDLAQVAAHAAVADQILVDTKPPKNAILPGGNGVAFDWGLVAGLRWPVPWMLAGGLTPDNVADAIAQTGAWQVDVASGVESAPGVKDAQMIADFVKAAQQA